MHGSNLKPGVSGRAAAGMRSAARRVLLALKLSGDRTARRFRHRRRGRSLRRPQLNEPVHRQMGCALGCARTRCFENSGPQRSWTELL